MYLTEGFNLFRLLQGSPVLVAKKDGSSSAGLGVSRGCGPPLCPFFSHCCIDVTTFAPAAVEPHYLSMLQNLSMSL